MDLKEDYLNYFERMNRFNDFENNYDRLYDEKKKIAQFIALFEFGYKVLPLEKIELIQNESLENKIKIQSIFALIADKISAHT